MKKKFKQVVAAAVVTSMFLLTGCAGNSDNATTGNQGADNSASGDVSEGVAPIKMQLCYWDSDAPTGDALLFQEIEKAVGVEIDATWVPPSAMSEKTSTTISGGNLPEVLEIINPEMRTQIVSDAMVGGMFWDLTDYIPEFPNLTNLITENTYNSMRYEGRIYTLPRMTPSRESGVVIREDWLENLGLEMPKTLEDYYEVLRAFTEDDPDGNGVDDTTGMSMFNGCIVMPMVLAAGCPVNMWIDETDNTVKAMEEHPQYMTYLNFMKDVYEKGYVNQDFTATNQTSSEQVFMEGKVGMIPGSIGKIAQATYFQPLYDRDANAKLVASTDNIGPDGKTYASSYPGYWGIYAISKSAVPDEARLKEILQFFNDTMNEEVVDLFVKGIEGVHYTEEDGKFEWIDIDKYIEDSKGISAFYVSSIISEQWSLGIQEHDAEYYAWQTNKDAIDLPQIASWFITPSNIPTSTMATDAANNYVSGTVSEDELRSTWTKWQEEGGSDLLAAYTEQYQAMIQ